MSSDTKVFVLNPKEYFGEVVAEAFSHRKITTFPMAKSYLIGLLQHFIDTKNLFPSEDDSETHPKTLAEMLLQASSVDNQSLKTDLLKKLGDSSLYISGFFSDSLNKKIIDVDYYAEMGGLAYSVLASHTREDMTKAVYQEYSGRFLEFAEVLGYISQKVFIQSDSNLLRLYDQYLKTGSKLAFEILVEKGIIPSEDKKALKQ